MGFLFNLLLGLIVVPLTVVLIILWLIKRDNQYKQILFSVWFVIIALIVFVYTAKLFNNKMELDHNDIHGEYIIDRKKFSGKQADWQYDHFRFEITKKNEFLFHLTEKDKIIKTYKGKVEFLKEYNRPRIILHVDTPRHHVIEDMPTLYRGIWSFNYVFNSPYFGNVFFTKGKWQAD